MANEFKIKTGLLLGPVPTQPVVSIRDTSVSITSDASSILVTGKAIYDYVSTLSGASSLAGLSDVSIVDISFGHVLVFDPCLSGNGMWKNVAPIEASLHFVSQSQFDSSIQFLNTWNLSQDASFQRIDVSLNDTIDALLYFVPNASLGAGLYWVNGYLDVSIEGGGGGTGLSIKETSSNYTALSNYIILANSSWNTIDITLPASPANGDIVQVIDINKCSSTNNINILRNTHTIDKQASNFTLDINGGSIELIYHSLNDNFSILDLETLSAFSAGGSSASVDASIVRIDSSINVLFSLVLDTSTIEIGSQTTDGSWRLTIDTSGNLSVQKRITGSWVEKGNFN